MPAGFAGPDFVEGRLKGQPVQRRGAVGEQLVQDLVHSFLSLGGFQVRLVAHMAGDAHDAC